MEAQEAAKKVSLGMNNLTLSELMEVYRALKDSDYAQELKLVSGYARGRVAVYGSSRRSSMSMDEINALYDLIETFGHNNAGELTAEGAKAKAFADKMSEKAKETAVDSVVRKLHDEEKRLLSRLLRNRYWMTTALCMAKLWKVWEIFRIKTGRSRFSATKVF